MYVHHRTGGGGSPVTLSFFQHFLSSLPLDCSLSEEESRTGPGTVTQSKAVYKCRIWSGTQVDPVTNRNRTRVSDGYSYIGHIYQFPRGIYNTGVPTPHDLSAVDTLATPRRVENRLLPPRSLPARWPRRYRTGYRRIYRTRFLKHALHCNRDDRRPGRVYSTPEPRPDNRWFSSSDCCRRIACPHTR